MPTMRRSGVRALTAIAVASTLALSGCSVLFGAGADAQRDEEGNVTEDASIDIFALKVGDCMPVSEGEAEISEASVVPCSSAHGEEVFFEFSAKDGDFPGRDAIMSEAETQCTPAFESFVGISYEESMLDWYPITPTEGTWESLNDRVTQCVVYDPNNEELVGSLEGAAR